MSMKRAVVDVITKYYDFSGRAPRSEFWWWQLAVVLAALAVGWLGIDALIIVFLLAQVLPSLAVAFRRLHDTNRSAWWLLLGPVPVVGLVLLVFALQDGTPGPNRYGPSPKTAEAGLAPLSPIPPAGDLSGMP